jgi:8-oxo-dGTP diphosphatase
MSSVQKRYEYDYPRPAVSVDVVVLRASNGGDEILLIQRGREPFAGLWALPGGFLDMDETLEEAARRELREETGCEVDRVVQVGAFSEVDRDPRGRVISVGFLAELDGGNSGNVIAGDDAVQAEWFPSDRLPKLAFDHDQIIRMALLVRARNGAA